MCKKAMACEKKKRAGEVTCKFVKTKSDGLHIVDSPGACVLLITSQMWSWIVLIEF